MHVMVVNNAYPPFAVGGAELIVSYLSEGLARRGHRVTVVSTCGPDMEPYPVEIRNGVEVIRFFPPNLYWSFRPGRQSTIRKWAWHARDSWNRSAGRRLGVILATTRPDAFHTHLIDGFSATIWERMRRTGRPIVHTAHDYHLLCPRAFLMTPDWRVCSRPQIHCRLYRSWHLNTTRLIDLFVSPSRFLLDKHERAGMPAARSMVIHNGIPLPEDMDRVRQRRPPGSRRRFLMLSRLTVEKGVRVVLDAVARLPVGLDIEVAIGGTGPLEQEVRAAATHDRRIVYLGFVNGEAKSMALSRAGYLLLPSLWHENAPVTIIEAAAYGLGMIASNMGGIPEFVEANATGMLLPPGDVSALTRLMERLTQDEDTLPDLSERSLHLARRFSVDRMVDAYETQYAELAELSPSLAVAE